MSDASAISATMQEQFEGFSYAGNDMGSMSSSVIDKMSKINIAGSVSMRAPLRK